MNEAVASYLSAPPAHRQAALQSLIATFKRTAAGEPAAVAPSLRRIIDADLDYSGAEALSRLLRKLPKTPAGGAKRLAILGGFTTDQLARLIELFLFAADVPVEIYQADYGVYQQEILDPTSGLHAFRPDVIYLAVHRQNLGPAPEPGDDAARVEEIVRREVAGWSALWQAAHARLGCQVIQNNFDPPAWRVLANHEMRHPAGVARFIARVNDALQDAAPPFVTIHDVDHLAASAGRWAWGDERFYYHAKMPCAPEFLVGYARSVASIVAAQSGRARKCLVLDLDNTVWGGVVGDDGLAGIRIGHGEAEGEAFAAFQRYALDLGRRGVILAVCSKNNEAIAREAFEKHPEMVLRLADIACFCANWEDKATNLKRIAKSLDIGLNALVFVDDNPAERALIRQLLPDVAVPELPLDPSGYVHAVERHNYFQTVAVVSEDLRRTDMYRANALRQEAQTTAGDLDQFLASLQMAARVEPVSADTLERTAQLIARSNQFNLTTRRHGAAAVAQMAADDAWLTWAISLADRFGDNGMISVVLANVVGDALKIDTWLMSCRVLKRGVERFVLNQVCAAARARGLRWVVGEYLPTPKNALVRDHYAGLGFEQASADPDGRTTWRLAVDAAAPLATFIREIPHHGR